VSLLGRWGKLVEAAPREVTSFLYLFAARRGQPPLARALTIYADDDTDTAVAALTPLLSIAPVLQQQAQLVPYAAIVPPADAAHYGGQEQALFSNGFAEHLDDQVNDIVADGLRSTAAPWIAIRAVGGAVNDVDPAATAYAHRHQNFNVSSTGFDPERFRDHWDELRPHLDGLYLSFETDIRPERLPDAFPGRTLTRLRELKARYDPDGVFNQNFPITPAKRPFSLRVCRGDLPYLADGVAHQYVPGSGVGPPPAEPGVQHQAQQYGDSENSVDHRDPALGSQYGIIQRPAGPGLTRRQREHHCGGHRRPDDPGDRVPRVITHRQYHRGLHQKVDSQRGERVPDQPQAPALAFCAGS